MLRLFLITALLAVTTTTHGAVTPTTLSEDLRALAPGSRRDIIIEMEPLLGSVLTNPSLAGLSGDEHRDSLVHLMRQKARATQLPVMNALTALGLGDRAYPFWIANRIAVDDVDIGAIQALSKLTFGFPLVIREPVQVKTFPTTSHEEVTTTQPEQEEEARADGDLQYGVTKINAPQVWARGSKGEGIVVGIIDTGAYVQHEALKDAYKNDEYSWLDAFGNYSEPHDGNSHGTHCAGTICGRTNGIGVAPAAKFIACRGLDDKGSGSDKTLLKCGEFMTCPSLNRTASSRDDETNSTKCLGVPHIISNSWGGAFGAQDFYNEVIGFWRAANIIPIFALGNSGPVCMTAASPGDQENVISVGATDVDDKLASFSSRGPAPLSGRRKPEVSAPGVKIMSADIKAPNSYQALSGTSMACPHVAGATALLMSANRELDFTKIKKAFESTTVKPKLGFFSGPQVCDFPPNSYPNNGYGHGRINVEAAVVYVSPMIIDGTTTTTTSKPV